MLGQLGICGTEVISLPGDRTAALLWLQRQFNPTLEIGTGRYADRYTASWHITSGRIQGGREQSQLSVKVTLTEAADHCDVRFEARSNKLGLLWAFLATGLGGGACWLIADSLRFGSPTMYGPALAAVLMALGVLFYYPAHATARQQFDILIDELLSRLET